MTFSNTVVDRIVPQEQEAGYNYPNRLLQVRDRNPIVTEPFWQFVVEDNFTGELFAPRCTMLLVQESISQEAVRAAFWARVGRREESLYRKVFHLFSVVGYFCRAALAPVFHLSQGH